MKDKITKSRKYYAAPIKKPLISEKKYVVKISTYIEDVRCESRPVMYDGNRKFVVHNLYNTYVYGR